MADTPIQIIVSAVDEASETLGAVADNLNQVASGASEVGDAAAAASDGLSGIGSDAYDAASGLSSFAETAPEATDGMSAVTDALESVGLTMNSVTGEIEAAALTQQDSFNLLAEVIQADSEEIQQLILDEGISFEQAASVVAEANDLIASSSDSAKSAVAGIGSAVGILALAGPLKTIADDLLGPVQSAIGAAAEKTSVLAQGLQEITNVINAASGPDAQNATQIADLKAKIDGYKASIAQATVVLETHTGSEIASAAAHQKAAADIEQAQVNLAKYQNELDALASKQDLAGASASDVQQQFIALAESGVAAGVSFNDSYNALVGFFNQTGNVKDATLAYNDALGLAVGHGMDMTTATNAVTQAFNGMGRGLQKIVPDLKDGVAGTDALNQIWTVVQGSVPLAMQQLNTQIAALGTNLQQLGATAAANLVPQLVIFLTTVNQVIQKVTEWTDKHPQLTADILAVVGAVGLLFAGISALIVILAPVVIAISLLGPAALAAAGPWVALAVAIVALAALIIANWTTIKANVTKIWDDQLARWNELWQKTKDTLTNALNWIANFVNTSLTGLQTLWNTVWGGIATFFEGIWDGMKNSVTSAIGFIQTVVSNFISWAEGVLGPVLGPINAIGSAASAFGKAAGGAVSSVVGAVGNVLNVHDAIITPGGQVIQSDPADFLIATKTPGSLIGAGGSGATIITVNIQGGNYLDSQGAKMIGDELAKQIIRNIKVRNYAS